MEPDVPEGWIATRIGELGSTYPGLSGKTKDDFGAGKPFVTYTQVFEGGRINLGACDSVVVDVDERQHRVRYGDVLFTTSSETAEEVAYSAVVLDEVPELYLNSFCFGFRPISPDELLPEFSAYFFRGPDFRRAAVQLGQGSTRFNISKNRVMDIVLALPPHSEQRKIACILSSLDDAIAATRKVIEQTNRVKQGLLQTLLTSGIGHTRFKNTEVGEIPEAWEVVRLGEVYSERKECGLPGLPVMSVTLDEGLVLRESLERRVESSLKVSEHALVRAGDLVYNTMRMWQGASGVATSDCLVSPAYVVAEPSDRILPQFARFLFKAPRTVDALFSYSHGITRDRLRLYYDNFVEVPIALPPLEEQRRIAELLSGLEDLGHREQAAERRLTRVKRGLMQDLLTGRVRVQID